jgi:hypothetical protein
LRAVRNSVADFEEAGVFNAKYGLRFRGVDSDDTDFGGDGESVQARWAVVAFRTVRPFDEAMDVGIRGQLGCKLSLLFLRDLRGKRDIHSCVVCCAIREGFVYGNFCPFDTSTKLSAGWFDPRYWLPANGKRGSSLRYERAGGFGKLTA